MRTCKTVLCILALTSMLIGCTNADMVHLSEEEISVLRQSYPAYSTEVSMGTMLETSFQDMLYLSDGLVVFEVVEQLESTSVEVSDPAIDAINEKTTKEFGTPMFPSEEEFLQYTIRVTDVLWMNEVRNPESFKIGEEYVWKYNSSFATMLPYMDKFGQSLISPIFWGDKGSYGEGTVQSSSLYSFYLTDDAYILSTSETLNASQEEVNGVTFEHFKKVVNDSMNEYKPASWIPPITD